MQEPIFELSGKKIWVAGHRGMVGSALMRRLAGENCDLIAASRSELDLSRQREVETFVGDHKPDAIIIAAAKVGGILANSTYPADFIFDNLQIATNILGAAHLHDVTKVTYLGSSCIYPKLAPQPMAEDALLTGPLEPTNEWYAVAKIAGIKLCVAFRKQYGRDYISCMPTNLYGPNDNFDLNSSHVLPALIAKAHAAKMANAKTFPIWGSGSPFREFMHVDDCADAIVFLTKYYSGEGHINVGTGEEVSIRALAEAVKAAVGLEAELVFDATKPDGTPRKLMDASRLHALGYRHKISLQEGIAATYAWYREHELAETASSSA